MALVPPKNRSSNSRPAANAIAIDPTNLKERFCPFLTPVFNTYMYGVAVTLMVIYGDELVWLDHSAQIIIAACFTVQ